MTEPTTPTQRIRGREHQRIRDRILRRDPICVCCLELGFCLPSVDVDHIVPLYRGGTESDDNRQGLCSEHHVEKTRADMGHKPKGCDASGMPTDLRHPWNVWGGAGQKSGADPRETDHGASFVRPRNWPISGGETP